MAKNQTAHNRCRESCRRNRESTWQCEGNVLSLSGTAQGSSGTIQLVAEDTGCIFASAIAANLAHKKTVRESVTAAKEFITAAIRAGLAIGKGYGPADPMASLYTR